VEYNIEKGKEFNMSFVLITTAQLKEKKVLEREFTPEDELIVLYQDAKEKIEINTMRELAERNIRFSFLSNMDGQIGYAAIFQLGKLVQKEGVNSILVYDQVNESLIKALEFCDLKVENISNKVVTVEEPKRRGRKPAKSRETENIVVNG